MKNSLVLQDVTVTIDNHFKLHNISLTLETGSVMCLTGQTGAGKTALIKTIMNCIKRDSGQILYDGLTFYENEIEVKKKVGCNAFCAYTKAKRYCKDDFKILRLL